MSYLRSGYAVAALMIFVFLVTGCFGQTHPFLRVDEQQIKFRLDSHPVLELPIVNTSDKTLVGDFRLELLSANNEVESFVTGKFEEKPGTTLEKVEWPLDYLFNISPSSLGWRRLHYSFVQRPELGVAPAEGFVQLSRILVGVFEVRVTAASKAEPGNQFPVRVRVDDPSNGKPLRGTAVDLTLELGDDDDKAIKHSVTTDYSGYAVYSFDLPKEIEADEGTVTAEAKRGPYSEKVELTFDLRSKGKLTLTTDKPLYQPGQQAHLRVLAFGPDKRAFAGKDFVITIEDEDRDEQFHETVKTSRFGVASIDWDIPQKLRLGEYQVHATLKGSEDDYDAPQARTAIRVSRYELPTFTVKADPDRKYYLPGEDATITISADYLFGKPVSNATVRLVNQQNRHWDFKEQKWVTEESHPIEGTFDKEGKFEAKVDLQDEFKDFNPEDYSHYEDLTLAAYVTDVSTKRTEERRFRIRLSEKPIQLYVISGDSWSAANEASSLYVTSSYADGTPASISGVLYFAEPANAGEFEKVPWQGGRSKVLTFHTNRFGVGKVTLPRIRDRFLVTPRDTYRYYYSYSHENDHYRNALLLFEAKDNKGRQARTAQEWTLAPERTYLRVNTTEVLYRPGDALPITIESNSPVHDVIVDVSTRAGLVSSRVVRLANGRAELSFEYDSRLSGEVEITAFALTESPQQDDYALSGTAHVIYPALQDLRVGLKMAHSTYRPGETASADFTVRSPEGKSVESDLGVLVFDRAVAERVRSDEEFGRPYGFSIYDYLGDSYIGKIAGIGYRDLLGLNPNEPFTADLQLLAEALMCSAQYNWWYGNVQLKGGENYSRGAGSVFAELITNSLKPVREALQATYDKEGRYPKNDAELSAILAAKGIDLVKITDPWGLTYRTEYSVSGAFDVLTFKSNGPDKKAGTADDADATSMQWQYFRQTGQIIDQIAREYPYNTGKYIRDYSTLRELLKTKDLDPDTMIDPWGHHYRFSFETVGPYFKIFVTSAGPDGVLDSRQTPSWDDVQEWTSSIHYFVKETEDLERTLAEHFAATKQFPQTEDELKPILASAHITGDRLLDPWGRPYHFTFSKRSRYWDRVNVSTYYDYTAAKERRVTEVTPVTQEMAFLTVSSYGPENQAEQGFNVAEFSRVLAEQSSKNLNKKSTSTTQGPLPSGSGAITGVVTDQSGAVVANATVTVLFQNGQSETTTTDSNGRYLISSLSAGTYEVEFNAAGFQQTSVTRVPVQPGATTNLEATLHVGTVSEAVEVTAEAATLNTESAQVASTVAKTIQGTAAPEKPLFTPRLRKYFPETLVWKPEVITDNHGRAHLDFPMADNITAWSMSVIASTETGQVGVAQKELRTFQPFFVEHDPPKVLTQGDQISLPVVLRNYSDKQLTLLAELKSEAWFSMLSPLQQNVTVAAGADANAVFTFKATARANPGKQRVTAHNSETGDAVEREVQVHPDGEEISSTTGQLLAGDNQTLEIEVPPTIIPGSIDAELRIYPNLIAHVLDAMNGIAKRPAGCAEQITSIGYVSLQALQLLKKAGVDAATKDSRAQVYAGALKSVQDAYTLLPSLQKANGGFSYWGSTSEDVALTAYVLRFLEGASDFVAVDAKVLSKARWYLTSRQTPSGAWTRYDWSTKGQVDDPMKTAYVARALATSSKSPDTKEREAVNASVGKALSYLDDRIDEWRDPYLVGNYAIAAIDAKRQEHIANARELLARLAHNEGPTTYWNLEANTTPFFGWGTAGRLETTALAVEALAKLEALGHDPALAEQVNRGLQYLLTHKDRYACWYSTQATQNVIEAMIAATPVGKNGSGDDTASVLVNGTKLTDIKLPQATEVVGPRVIDFGKELNAGSNKVAIQRTGDNSAMQTNVITSYYIPWPQAEGTQTENFRSGDTRALKLKVDFDRQEAKVGEALVCRVEAERIGFAGYGMMIAEIGLPPGVEVDRESLEEAKQNGVDGYEVQPDRIVFYLWPSAGGTKFKFVFRPRFGINAMSSPSVLYDYYNPEARAAVLPIRFNVQ
jgi:A-macroglobulin TED domain/Carboxypeptidase regulatory-like domain/Alpha-2-macroglobulin family/MG2 domain/A-macroglobulin receptor binding domain/Macroglobulin domain MG3